LGTLAAEAIDDPHAEPTSLAGIVAAACLAHDIGNPPFGHSGEAAIQGFFKGQTGGKYVGMVNSPDEKADMEKFDGNAAGFRILTNHKKVLTSNSGGLSLTMPTLAAYTKYPKASAAPIIGHGRASEKKPGITHDSIPCFEEVASTLGIKMKASGSWYRHPLAFLTEAADDICYWIVDLEDAYKLRLVSYDEAFGALTAICSHSGVDGYTANICKIKAKDQQIGYLRAKAINCLVHEAANAFADNLEAIYECEFDRPLLEVVGSSCDLAELRGLLRKYAYSYRPVLEVEAAGFHVLGGLLELFLDAAVDTPGHARSRKIRELIPRQFLDEGDRPFDDPYLGIMNIVEYVTCMTDSYAIDLYRTLTGISLPNARP
jgi:dGTPase